MPAEDLEPTVSSPPAAQTKESPLTDIATSPPPFSLPDGSVIDRSNEDSSELSDLGDEDSEAETDKMDFLEDESNSGIDNPLDLHALSKLTELAKLEEVDDDLDDDTEMKKRSRDIDDDQELEEAKKLKFEPSDDLVVIRGGNAREEQEEESHRDDNSHNQDHANSNSEGISSSEAHSPHISSNSSTGIPPGVKEASSVQSEDNEPEAVGLESTGKLSIASKNRSPKTGGDKDLKDKIQIETSKDFQDENDIQNENYVKDEKEIESVDDIESRSFDTNHFENNLAQSITSNSRGGVDGGADDAADEEDAAVALEVEEEEEDDDVDEDEEEESTKTKVSEQDDFDLNEKRKVAIEELIHIEEEFARLRDKLYQDKLDLLEHELQLCLEGSHPELSKIYYKVNGFYQENIKYANSNLNYRLRCIDKQTLASRTGVHQDFLKNMMDTKNEMIAETTSLWYKINKERNAMDQLVPDFNYRAVPSITDSKAKNNKNLASIGDGVIFDYDEEPVAPLPPKVVKQKTIYELVKQRNSFNQELGVNRALLEFHGFPSSIARHFMDDSLSPVEELLLRKASEEQINDDLKAMGILT